MSAPSNRRLWRRQEPAHHRHSRNSGLPSLEQNPSKICIPSCFKSMASLTASLSIYIHKNVRHKILPSSRVWSAEIFSEILANLLASVETSKTLHTKSTSYTTSTDYQNNKKPKQTQEETTSLLTSHNFKYRFLEMVEGIQRCFKQWLQNLISSNGKGRAFLTEHKTCVGNTSKRQWMCEPCISERQRVNVIKFSIYSELFKNQSIKLNK